MNNLQKYFIFDILHDKKEMQFNSLPSTFEKRNEAENKEEKKESENDNWSSSNSTANQFEDIEIPDAREEEDEDDEELNRRLYIPPNLIYLYQSMSPNDTKDEFIDSMSDIFTIENLQNNDMN